MAEAGFSRLIQICPHDHPPFLDICRVYRKAATAIGLDGEDFFLAPAENRFGDRLAFNSDDGAEPHYLDCQDLRHSRRLVRMLRQVLPDCSSSLVLCHRYRAYKAFLGTGLQTARIVAVAHEHGFFKRRRLLPHLSRRKVEFAGVAPGVVSDLQRTTKNVSLWPNALDIKAVRHLDRAAARRMLELPQKGLVIAVVGRLHYKKQPLLALEAFRWFLQQGGDSHLAFVGDGPLQATLKAASANLPVSFPGFVANASCMMGAFDALLLTSSKKEAFGMVLLEAMAAGVPVVAPRQPGPQSILGDVGHYFECAEPSAIAAAVRQASESPNAGGPERAKRHFSVNAVTERLNRLRQDTR